MTLSDILLKLAADHASTPYDKSFLAVVIGHATSPTSFETEGAIHFGPSLNPLEMEGYVSQAHSTLETVYDSVRGLETTLKTETI
jgi:hypothetical protein